MLTPLPSSTPPLPAPLAPHEKGASRATRRPPASPRETALGRLGRADRFLVSHSVRTARIAAALGRRLGWSEVAALELERAALFHDIGKTMLPHSLLVKPGPLTSSELALVRRHAPWGATLLARLSGVPPLAPQVARHHHERWDGTGYPDGRSGLDIPEAARIVAVADAFDALTADRTYREPIPPSAALERLGREAGGQFDTRAYAALVALVAADDLRPAV
ncbi:MAG: HD-GYP domain-containing protein [Thermoanaerobaculia bacterium]